MQIDLSEKEAAIACANSQLQEEQARNITLHNKAEAESSEAAATAAAQMQQSEKLAQQLQAQVDAAQLHGEGLQTTCDNLSRKNEDLIAELSGSKVSVENLQVSFIVPLLHLLVYTVSTRLLSIWGMFLQKLVLV